MNESRSFRKRNNFRSGLIVLLAVLIVLEVCSLSVVFSRLAQFSSAQTRNIISLTEGTREGTVQVGKRDENGIFVPGARRSSRLTTVFSLEFR